MNYHDRRDARKDIDHIFKDLLPIHGMPERPEQIALSHRMLEAMQGGGIALCDAGTGIGKTYAYLVAGIVFHGSPPSRPVLVSTSSIALQKAVRDEYLPFLSAVLMADGMISVPIEAVIRKGKSHYVCDQRLERRLGQLDLRKKNWRAGNALLSLRETLDLDEAPRLSGYDRERVCVPKVCDCGREDCRYHAFLDSCDGSQYSFQICNHNLLLADAIHRGTSRQPILPDSLAVIIDEAHKLPETARLLVAPNRAFTVVRKQVNPLLSPATRKRLDKLASTVALFSEGRPDMVFYLAEDARDTVMLCATVADLTAQLQSTLWSQPRPIILTSGTLAVGSDFRRFREEAGLLEDSRVTESVSFSPFDYRENCLLYVPQFPPGQRNEAYYDKLTNEIALLLDAACGHALVLFTSYAAMSAVKERLTAKDQLWPLFTLGRNAGRTTEQFKASPGSVLLATGAAWEGFDFPSECVSLLVIPRLPFARPDALKEKEREAFPNLHSFIQAIVVPEMQIKLKQGFGRAIRTETDTCVVAILDERSVPGQRYFEDVKTALPDMRITDSLQEVEAFIRSVKEPGYFREGSR